MKKPIGQWITTDAANNRLGAAYPPAIRERLARSLNLRAEVLTPETIPAADTAQVEYLLTTWGMPALDDAAIAAAFPRLKAVLYGAGTVQGFARPFLRRGVRVFSAWGANGVPVAEYTVAQIVLANKGFYQSSRIYKETGDYRAAARHVGMQPGNYRAKVGILGGGMIGKLVLEMLKGYVFDVYLFDAFLDEKVAQQYGATKVGLNELFSTCDVISNHIANNPQTVGMFRYEHFAKMLPHATFINTGRGQQVVEADLARALREGPDRTAVLDVTWPEPVEKGSPLLALPNAVLTPHIAGSIAGEIERMGLYMAEELENMLAGRPVRFEVTEDMLETMA